MRGSNNHIATTPNQPELPSIGREQVAIVGMGCRFPGVDSVESFWQVIRGGLETVGEYPGGRFAPLDKVYSGTRVTSRRGGFLPKLDYFDAGFFEVSAREARMLDPQQRLLLEVSWEALEDAGIPARKLRASRTGVFMGVWTSDYEDWAREAAPENLLGTTGTGRYAVAGRVAYFFDFRGPTLSIDTACSSSLVAIHLACKSLLSGESEMALAGGVNVILQAGITLAYSASGMLSPDGRSKFGDAAADGYVRSEGAGVLVLKTLERAMADRDPIHALILGSAVNNDGRASGRLVAPSCEAQEAVLRAALEDAGVSPDAVDYIEAHGAGTPAGDPVEIEAIGRVMATGTRRHPCPIGSVKTNIGHTESAAGVAGVIKSVLSLKHAILPASLHFESPNPAIRWNQIPVKMQTEAANWPQNSRKRIVGVNGFGITGTNAHLILQAVKQSVPEEPSDDVARLFLISAHTPEALRAMAASWRDRLWTDPTWPDSMGDLAFTAAARRTHLDFRLAITACNRGELSERLTAWLGDESSTAQSVSGRSSYCAGRVAFVFPGQGGQWIGMGRTLLREERVFRDVLEECDRAVRKHIGWSVLERLVLTEDERIFGRVEIVQPVLFSVMVGLAALWRSWGLEPHAVVGHSMGEAAAASVCGALSIEDAAAVICHRSALMKNASGRGSMALAQLGLEEATRIVARSNGRLSVAASNSPESTVLSGDTELLDDVLSELERREVFCRRIKVDVASHSAHMDPLAGELARRLEGIHPRPSAIPFYSTTTGRIENGSDLNADYWSRNLRLPVLFSTAMKQLLADGFHTFLEINAHPVLSHAIAENGREADEAIVSACCLDRDREERRALLNAAGLLAVNGAPVSMERLYPKGRCISLPNYPWQRERHWLDGDFASNTSTPLHTKEASELLCLDHIYQLRWIQRDAPAQSGSRGGNRWVVIGECDVARAIAKRMKASDDECIQVSRVGQLPKTLECGAVVFIATETKPGSLIEETYDAVRLVQSLTASETARLPRLWLVTRGCFRLPEDSGPLSLAGSPDWGLARVVACEYPELRCVNLDLSLAPQSEELETFLQVLREDPAEEQMAIRGERRFVARYEARTDVKAANTVALRPDATYLITGGLGGIGLELARWLTLRGARHLALLGRRSPSESAHQRIAAMESLGASVRVFSTDVSDYGQLSSTLATITAEMPTLRGVFHLSGVLNSVLLSGLDERKLRAAMLPKAWGAWNLHRAVEDVELDFFVLFSSLAAVWSQPGLANYAAANSFTDSLARFRRAKNLPALSIQWPPWTDLGLVQQEGVQEGATRYRDQGITPVSPERALEALGRMMLVDADVLLVMPAQWTQFAQSVNGAMPSAFSDLDQRPAAEAPAQVEQSVRVRLSDTPAGRRRRNLLEAHVQEAVARVLKMEVRRIERMKPLGSMGLNSLMALELARFLSAATGVRLPATAIFNHPTIVLLAGEVARRMDIPLDAEERSPATSASTPKEGVPADATQVSDEAAIAALMGRTPIPR